MYMCFVLFTLRRIWFAVAQSLIVLITSCVLSSRMFLNIMYVSRSSAYLIILVFSGRLSYMSIMKIRKRIGPSTLPWITPAMTVAHSEKDPFYCTRCFLLFRNCATHDDIHFFEQNPVVYQVKSIGKIKKHCMYRLMVVHRRFPLVHHVEDSVHCTAPR
jgi:hypothetical protein